MPAEKPKNVGDLLVIAARLWSQALGVRLRGLGLWPGQVPVLRALLARDGQTQAELRRDIGVEQPTLANTLKRMVRDGLVARRVDPKDRRRVFLHLTDTARGLLQGLDLAEQDLDATVLAPLAPEQRAALAAGLESLAAALRADLDAGLLVLLDVLPEEDQETVAQNPAHG